MKKKLAKGAALHYFFESLVIYRNRIPVLVFLMTILTLAEGFSVLLILPMLHGVFGNPNSEVSYWFLETVITWFDHLILTFFSGTSETIVFSAMLLMLFVVKTIFSIWTNKLIIRFPWEWIKDKRLALMKSYFNSDYLDFTKQRQGELINTLIMDCNQGAIGIQNFLSLVSNSLIALVFVLILFATDFRISIIILSVIIVILLISIRFIHISSKETGNYRVKLNAKIWHEANQNITGIVKIWMLGLEQVKLSYFQSLLEKLSNLNAREAVKQKIPSTVTPTLVVAVLALCVIYFELFSEVSPNEQIPIITLFLIISYRLFSIFSTLASSYIGFVNRIANFESIEKALDRFSGANSNRPGLKLETIEGTIRFVNVTFRYGNNSKLLFKQLNVEFPVKRTSLIFGQTGSGKSSLINLLLGFLKPVKGEILINNRDLQSFDIRQVRTKMGYVSQDIFMFNDTILENLRYCNPLASTKEITEALTKAGFELRPDKFPEGLNTVVGEKGIRLSGGEKQRIAIAACFLQDAEVLIFDEPTSALDHETESIIIESLQSLHRLRTIIVISHNQRFAKFADEIYSLDNGKLHMV